MHEWECFVLIATDDYVKEEALLQSADYREKNLIFKFLIQVHTLRRSTA